MMMAGEERAYRESSGRDIVAILEWFYLFE